MALNTIGIQFGIKVHGNELSTENKLVKARDKVYNELRGIVVGDHPMKEGFGLKITEADKMSGANLIYLTDLQEVGELGIASKSSSGFDQIEVTTLADREHKYIDGLVADAGDENSELTFKFLYNKDVYQALIGLQAGIDEANMATGFFVEFTDTAGFNIEAKISKVAVDGISVGGAMTMTLTLSVEDIEFGPYVPAVPYESAN